MKGKIFFLFSWLTVFALSALDGFFAHSHSQTFTEWELNPFALFLFTLGGLSLCLIVKFTLLGLACLIAWCIHRHKAAWLITFVALGAHVLLLACYLLQEGWLWICCLLSY